MKLLHPLVVVKPGQRGARPLSLPFSEDQPLPGSAVLRLTNSTDQENAYTIWLRCEQRYWQENWYGVTSLTAPPPGGMPDQNGPQERWLKIYVAHGATRDVLIRFDLPPQPDSRAGEYRYQIEIFAEVIADGPEAPSAGQLPPIEGTALVLPFYEWSLDMAPEQQHVYRFFRRRREFEVVVRSESNDWLYCELQLPRPPHLLLDAPTRCIAVPPPEPGELLPEGPDIDDRPGTQRIVPLRAATQLRVFRGMTTPQPILLQAVRIEAPSLSPSSGAVGDPITMGNRALRTQEARPVVGDRSLLYHPPFYETWSDFVASITGSLRGALVLVILLFLALIVVTYAYENIWHRTLREVTPQFIRTPQPGKPLQLAGAWLRDCDVTFSGTENGREFHITRKALPLATAANDPNQCQVENPGDLDGRQGSLRAQRVVAFLPLLTPLLPASREALFQVPPNAEQIRAAREAARKAAGTKPAEPMTAVTPAQIPAQPAGGQTAGLPPQPPIAPPPSRPPGSVTPTQHPQPPASVPAAPAPPVTAHPKVAPPPAAVTHPVQQPGPSHGPQTNPAPNPGSRPEPGPVKPEPPPVPPVNEREKERARLRGERDALRLQIDQEVQALKAERAQIEELRRQNEKRAAQLRADADKVDRSSQQAVDAYNNKVEQFDKDKEAFNSRVEDYNNRNQRLPESRKRLSDIERQLR